MTKSNAPLTGEGEAVRKNSAFHGDPGSAARLSRLHFARHAGAAGQGALCKLNIVVVGAGPAGLVFARDASLEGAQVTVLEQADDPRNGNQGYTDRSFNITLNEVGRYTLGDTRAWAGGARLVGRAVHEFGDLGVRYTKYGVNEAADLVSLPRPVLRQNLVQLASEAGAILQFNRRVVDVDLDSGEVWYQGQFGGRRRLRADLVVLCDGLHSLGDVVEGENASCSIELEPRGYVMAMLPPGHGLSLRHIHFWHAPTTDSYVIGMPTHDGSLPLLLISRFEGSGGTMYPFAPLEEAGVKLRQEFPQIEHLVPKLADQLPSKRRGRFYYKLTSAFAVGKRGVVVGDAAYVFPPWSGFGANNAMYGASSLVYWLVQNGGDVEAARQAYQLEQSKLAGLVCEFVNAQGEFLNKALAANPDERSDSLMLGLLIAQATFQAAGHLQERRLIEQERDDDEDDDRGLRMAGGQLTDFD